MAGCELAQINPQSQIRGPSGQVFWWLPGTIAVGVVLLLVGAPFAALVSQAFSPDTARSGDSGLGEVLSNTYIQRVIWFSFYQALLSTGIALVTAIPLSLALSRRARFPGRRLLITLFSLSLIIPTVVAVFGIVAVYGRTGWLVQVLDLTGIESRIELYGLTGILLAHVFYNMPLATRVFLQSLESVPDSTWRLSAQLGLRLRDRFLFIEWPAIRHQFLGVALLVFSLCFASFAIVMTLGGGPASTTIEVAIYQAIRFDFDISLAVSLALIQISICIALMVLLATRPNQSTVQLTAVGQSQRYQREGRICRSIDIAVIALAFLFIIMPLLALFLAGINPALIKVLLHANTLKAAINTMIVALASGVLSVLLAYCLLLTARQLHVRMGRSGVGRALEMSGLAILVVPPVVLGTGLFILLRPYADVFSLALLLVVLVNALMGLPFVLRVLSTPMMENARNHDTLCASLAIDGFNRLRLIDWPTLRKPLGLSLALASTLSAGDFTVIALFGSERVQTLPLLLYQRMGTYRMQDAAGTALLLLVVCLTLFWVLDRVVGGRDAARR